ncbi:MAG: hypothetical protein K2X99_11090 [Gemmatimonadaceae bacterium]|nr:hypothetical protein [Gemmatimonadaceae bacterium]
MSPRRLDQRELATVSRKLRAWFKRHHRKLPWRETRDPYRILVSELMLQQTQVARVIDFYGAFLERFPTLEVLAGARAAQVREAWHGLGYYARARNLHALAKQVSRERDGALPSDPAELRTLPGIGPYTAGAVATFAFERPAALVDTNVARVLLRLFAPRTSPKSARGQRRAWEIAEAALPSRGATAWTHNQALMELGALVCTARVRHCARCPLRAHCATYAADRARASAAA